MEAVATKSIGICSTCNHFEDCLFRRRNGQPVWYCEEFDNFVALELAAIPEEIEVVPNGEVKLMGLCVNCEDRFTCTYPKPEGGVWHCEEYR